MKFKAGDWVIRTGPTIKRYASTGKDMVKGQTYKAAGQDEDFIFIEGFLTRKGDFQHFNAENFIIDKIQMTTSLIKEVMDET